MAVEKYRLLVVDDDPDVRFVVMSLLGLDFETAQACNGLDALEKIGRQEPDLLLMDVNMPVMNGLSCLSIIQRDPDFARLPVIFLSASSDPVVRHAAEAAGAVGYFEKPFETSALIARIHELFRSAGAAPRPKRFSIAELRRIDETPLQVEEDPASAEDSVSAPAPQHITHVIEGEGTPGRQRRVFGKARQAPAPPPAHAAPSGPEPEDTAVPEAPAPPVLLPQPTPALPPVLKEAPPPVAPPVPPAHTSPVRPPDVVPSTANVPLPPVAIPPAAAIAQPPPPPPKDMRPVAPPPVRRPAAPAGPSPAEVLAQRRLGALGRAPQKATTRPRVLVIIESPSLLPLFHEALRGSAEFLPLEDPVEAIALIARFQPDVVVLGIIESGYSGLQIASMLRSNPRLAHTEVVFVQSTYADSSHLAAAQRLSSNSIIRRPLQEASIRHTLQEVFVKPGFQIRQKQLAYGVYVKDVIQAAEAERAKSNKEREKAAVQDHFGSLASFMAKELRGYREPQGMEELKGIGAKVYEVKE